MKRFHWGWGIAIFYVIFAASTVSFVVFAMNTPVDLVRHDYYEESLRQDSLYAGRVRAQEVSARIDYRNGIVELMVLNNHRSDGGIMFRFYKPDKPSLDFDIVASFGEDGVARFDVSTLSAGKWNVTARWKSKNVQFDVNGTFKKD